MNLRIFENHNENNTQAKFKLTPLFTCVTIEVTQSFLGV